MVVGDVNLIPAERRILHLHLSVTWYPFSDKNHSKMPREEEYWEKLP